MTKLFTDKINGTFEVCGGFFILLHIITLLKDKSVTGVSWIAILFFTLWGWWNCIYYPKLNQKISFIGGAFVALMNTIWLILIIYYGGFH